MMQAFANREAVKHTLTTGKVCARPAWRQAEVHRLPQTSLR